MKIKAVIWVDEDTVKSVSEQDDLESAISMELGWIEQSGMSVEHWEEVREGETENEL